MNNRILYIPKERKYTQKKISSKNIWIVIGMGTCIILVVLSMIIVRSRAFQIQTIFINGLNMVSEEDVRKKVISTLEHSYFAGLVSYRFLPAASVQIIADAIKHTFPLIADVHIEKKFPNALTISVKERIMFGILCNDAINKKVLPEKQIAIQCAYLDTQGIAYASAPQTIGFLILKISTDNAEIAIGKQAIDPAMMRRIADINAKLSSIIGSPITGYQLLRNASREVRAISRMGFFIIINRDDDLNHAFSVLATVLKKEIGSKHNRLDYIDLRFGNKVFYKFR